MKPKSLEERLNILKNEVVSYEEQIQEEMTHFFKGQPKYIVFLSVSNGKNRARVVHSVANTIEAAWKNAVNLLKKVITKTKIKAHWVKADLVTDITTHTYQGFLKYVSNIRRNYFREGISLDPMFNTAFLEQEVNANAFLHGLKEKKAYFAFNNINFYMNTYQDIRFPVKEKHIEQVYTFKTKSFFVEEQNHYELHDGVLSNGCRKIEHIDSEFAESIINQTSKFLAGEVLETGQFRYGYFPAFDKEINTYNILRHGSTTYSMVEAYEITGDEELKAAIEKALQFLIDDAIKFVVGEDGVERAFVIEKSLDNEIKLGANAAAILAFAKYTTVIGDKQYIPLMEQLAEGILYFQDAEKGSFIHVLNYPDLSVKDEFRTIYYDGEAAFALMRLYEITLDDRWLQAVEKGFEHFIEADHWKHGDHWLSYCSNELFTYRPERKYAEFNLKNANRMLNFSLTRETAFPTLLELMMASYNMIVKMKEQNLHLDLLEEFDEAKLNEVIEYRVRHQLNSYFYPEMAMYFKVPNNILHSFYIRHHSYRVRIDDVEHNLSGYCSYYHNVLMREGDSKNKSYTSLEPIEPIKQVYETTDRYTEKYLKEVLGGYWYNPPAEDWYAETVTMSRQQCEVEAGKNVLFVAIDSDTWHKGSGNRGIYAGWTDTHTTVKNFEHLISGIIVQKPIEELDPSIPQLVVENSYEAILMLSKVARAQFQGKVIGITGTAGKSTTKEVLKQLLASTTDITATRGNHNKRTGVPLTVASAIHNPKYLILETAMSALWMRKGGIMKDIQPHIAIITSIDGGQQKTPIETARIKAKICEGMQPGGIVILNKEMNEFQTVLSEVQKYGNFRIITYGTTSDCDSIIMEIQEKKAQTVVKARVLGEEIEYTVPLLGEGMIFNTLGALTIVKLLEKDIQDMTKVLKEIQSNDSVMRFEEFSLSDNGSCTMLDDSWNATGVAMIQAIETFDRQSRFFSGKKVAILGRIENLGEDARRQHEMLVEPILQSSIDIVFAHGPEMKYVLEKLPSEKIGGYFENATELAKSVANLVSTDDFILLKGSPRSSDFKWVKREFEKALREKKSKSIVKQTNPFNFGAMTVDAQTGDLLAEVGNVDVVQNQGVANILTIAYCLDLIFKGELDIKEKVMPTEQSIRENKSLRSIKLSKDRGISIGELLSAAIVTNSPNAIILLSRRLFGDSKTAIESLQRIGTAFDIQTDSVLNLTGRKMIKQQQKINLMDLYNVSLYLFAKLPKQLDWLQKTQFIYNEKEYSTMSNLFNKGYASHALFYGNQDSIGLVLTKVQGQILVTVVLGANDAYHRDSLIVKSIETALKSENSKQESSIIESESKDDIYKLNVLGDTYFGEFYTGRRIKRKRTDALMKYGRAYSFNGIREFLSEGDYTIANFEAAITPVKESPLQASKPFVLHADVEETVPALKAEGIDAVTLGNNHLMDYVDMGLQTTLEQFKEHEIHTLGAGMNQSDAEKPLIKIINGKRYVFYSAYWYRNPMYRTYDFYALGEDPGVASLSGNLLENIRKEKEQYPDSYITVFAHWGVDFKPVNPKQRKDAYAIMDAGADLILGHGAHMMQEIEQHDGKYIVYSIGNGVFNSDGEYNRRFVAPYSFIAQLRIGKEKLKMRLYPIYSDNLATFWQPCFLNESQFKHMNWMLQSYGSSKDMSQQQDKQGRYYLEMSL